MTTTTAPNKAKAWRGRAVTQARDYMRQHTTWPHRCGQCGTPVTQDMDWVVGHIKPRAIYPELTWDTNNWRVEHRTCSNKTGQSVVIEKAKRDALASVGYTTNTNTDFSPARTPKE